MEKVNAFFVAVVASCVSSCNVSWTKGSFPHYSALADFPELGPLGAMAPLLDARTAHGGACARIEKRRLGLFVAGPQAFPRSVTPAVADDSLCERPTVKCFAVLPLSRLRSTGHWAASVHTVEHVVAISERPKLDKALSGIG